MDENKSEELISKKIDQFINGVYINIEHKSVEIITIQNKPYVTCHFTLKNEDEPIAISGVVYSFLKYKEDLKKEVKEYCEFNAGSNMLERIQNVNIFVEEGCQQILRVLLYDEKGNIPFEKEMSQLNLPKETLKQVEQSGREMFTQIIFGSYKEYIRIYENR